MSAMKPLLPLLKTLLPLLLLAVLADGQAVFNGTCPQGQAVEKFSPKAVVNQTWYGYSTYVQSFESELSPSCISYRLLFYEGTLYLISYLELAHNGTGFFSTWETSVRNQTDADGLSTVTALNAPLIGPYRFEVLHTSSDLLILRMCINFVNETGTVVENGQFVDVMTKSQFPDTNLTTKISNEERRLNLDTQKLLKTNQQNCPYVL